jgi:hypothetical protein
VLKKGGGGKVAINPDQVAFVRSAAGAFTDVFFNGQQVAVEGSFRRDREAAGIADAADRNSDGQPRSAFGPSCDNARRANGFLTTIAKRVRVGGGSTRESRVKRLSFRLSQAVAGGRAAKAAPGSREVVLERLLRKRAAAYQAGLETRSRCCVTRYAGRCPSTGTLRASTKVPTLLKVEY